MNDKDLKLTDAELKKRILHALTHQSGDDEYLQETHRLNAEISEGVRKALAYRPPNNDEVKFRLAFKAIEAEGKLAAQERQTKSTPERRKNLEPRDRWMYEQYANFKKTNPRYTIGQLRTKLMRSRKFPKAQRQISEERVRQIVEMMAKKDADLD